VRTLYTAVRQKGFLQEVAGYTARTNAEAIMGFYEKNLGGDGWEEISRNENNYGTKGAHQIISTWKKSNRTASFTLVDSAPGSAEIQAIVEAKQ
jgi:hypothetical protein